jgi:UDP-N-acetylmuramyl pentapeptide phosphotransferase/UDP-N-acetylglucosamine-1-phosphate transferase
MTPDFSWLEVLDGVWWIAGIAFVAALIATPLCRELARRLKVVDKPDSLLKPHAHPTAYLGGVAICAGMLVGLLAYVLTMREGGQHWRELARTLGDLTGSFNSINLHRLWANPLWNLGAIVFASIGIMLTGLADDIRDIRPRKKVAAQVVAAGILVVGGVGTHAASALLHPFWDAPEWVVAGLSIPMCCILVIVTCNATNLLDGLDALAGGVTGIISLGFLALAVHLAMWNHFPGTDELRVVLCLAMVGAVIGFLPFNLPPASIFMGDAGSMLLGFFVATMMLMFCQEQSARWLLAAIVVFLLPIVDTSCAVIRRFRSGKHIFAGDRSHLYDQLVDRGMSVGRVITLFYLLAVLVTALGVVAALFIRLRYAVPVYALALLIVGYILYRKGMLTPTPKMPGVSGTDAKQLRILFTSVGRRVALLREFHRAARDLNVNLEIHAVDQSPIAPAMAFCDVASIVPGVQADDYIDRLVDYCQKHRIHAVIPLIDTELPRLAESRERFDEIETNLIISSEEVVHLATNKILTADFLADHGYLTPRILSEDELASPAFPLFIKPISGSASARARRLDSLDALQFFKDHYPESIIQEFVDGVEYTVDVFVDFDGKPICAVPRQRLEVRAGEVSKGRTANHAEIIKQCCRVVEDLGSCRGMMTLQCFLTADDRIVFIEFNPRFGGGVPLSIKAGADSPRWTLELLQGRRPTMPAGKGLDDWQDGLYMLRYDEAAFVDKDDLLHPKPHPPA